MSQLIHGKVFLLSNHDTFVLSKSMELDKLLEKVHEIQPGITMERLKGIIRACKRGIVRR